MAFESQCRAAHPEIVSQLREAIRNVRAQNDFERFCLDTWAAGRTPGASTDDDGVFTRLIVKFCKIKRPKKIDVLVAAGDTRTMVKHVEFMMPHGSDHARIVTNNFHGNPAIVFVYDSYWSIDRWSRISNGPSLLDVPSVWFDRNPFRRKLSSSLPTYGRNPFAADADIWENQSLIWAYTAVELKTCGDVARLVIAMLR